MHAEVASLVKLFAESQGRGDEEAVVTAYDTLYELGPTVIAALTELVADVDSPQRIAAIGLLECFHCTLDSRAALPSLRSAMKEGDPWLRLCAAEAIWIIEGDSPKDIAADALAVIGESAHSELARIQSRSLNTLRLLKDLDVTSRPSTVRSN